MSRTTWPRKLPLETAHPVRTRFISKIIIFTPNYIIIGADRTDFRRNDEKKTNKKFKITRWKTPSTRNFRGFAPKLFPLPPSPSWRVVLSKTPVFCILIKWVLYQFNNLIQSCAEFGPKPRLVNARVQVMMTRTVRLSVITFLKGSANRTTLGRWRLSVVLSGSYIGFQILARKARFFQHSAYSSTL